MQGLLMPCYVEGINTRKDKSVKIVLSTQELSPTQAGDVFNILNHLVIAYFSTKDISETEAEKVDKIDADLGGKTQSQRLRNVLYKLFEQDSEGHKTFDYYYHAKTEAIIEQLKARIK